MDIRLEIANDKRERGEIDVIIQRVKILPPSRERSICITKLQEAVMWLGMDLKRIAETHPVLVPDPYPGSKDPANPGIEPTADGLRM